VIGMILLPIVMPMFNGNRLENEQTTIRDDGRDREGRTGRRRGDGGRPAGSLRPGRKHDPRSCRRAEFIAGPHGEEELKSVLLGRGRSCPATSWRVGNRALANIRRSPPRSLAWARCCFCVNPRPARSLGTVWGGPRCKPG